MDFHTQLKYVTNYSPKAYNNRCLLCIINLYLVVIIDGKQFSHKNLANSENTMLTGEFVIDSPQKLKHKLEMVVLSFLS